MKRINELRQRRNELVTQARALLDKAEAEKRALTSDEEVQYDKLMKEQGDIRSKIEREERQAEAERELAGQQIENQRSSQGSGEGGQENRATGPAASPEYRDAFNAMLQHGMNGITPEARGILQRAMSMDNNAQGGFLATPVEFVDRLIQAVDDEVFVRQYATVERVANAQSLGAISLDNDISDPTWTSEILTGSEDNDMSLGKREFVPNPLAKRVKISNKLLARVGPRAANLVAARLGYKFGITQERAFFLGNGVGNPLGVFVAHNSGIPTGRDVANGNTTTGVTFDGLIAAKYSLKAQHQRKARWGFHRNGIEQIAKLKNGNGDYIWEASKKMGEPDMLLGLPVDMSEFIPNTFTTGNYVGILANWKDGYWIADALTMTIQVLKELYAETNQTGYIGRLETDGAPVLAEAFARVKLA